MNIYNVIGLSQNCENEKILKRVDIMLNFYYKDITNIENKMNILENKIKNINDLDTIQEVNCKNKNVYREIEDINNKIEIESKKQKLQTQMYNTNKIIGELEKAKKLFNDTNLRFKYESCLKNTPKLTLEQFFIKENIPLDSDICDNKQVKFNPNQRENYLKNYVKNVSYNMFLNQEQYEIFSLDEKVRISVLGRLDYETAIGVKDIGFYRYKIEKARIRDNYSKKEAYNVFSGINIKKMSEDINYKEYNLKVLFSDSNIKMALEYNGGYIGEVIENNENDSRNFCINYRTRKAVRCN